MKAYTNGFPKCGNHALVKAVQLLGVPCEVNHHPYWPTTQRTIIIKRDPRNVVLSWVRHLGHPVTRGMVMTHIRSFERGQSIVEAMMPFEGWLASSALVVSFEALTASDAELRRIADHLEVPYMDEAWRWLPGMTRTWNPQHSDWRALWTPQVQQVWESVGGNELLARWGY